MLPTIIYSATEKEFESQVQSRFGSEIFQSAHTYTLIPDDGVISVDQIRLMLKSLYLSHVVSTLVIKQLESATPVALQALLKTVEDEHERVQMIFWTRSIQQLPSTFLSRCAVVTVKNISPVAYADMSLLMERLQNGTVAEILSGVSVAGSSREEAEIFFQSIVAFLHSKAKEVPPYVSLAKPVLELYQLFLKNNINSQLAVDQCVLKMVALIRRT